MIEVDQISPSKDVGIESSAAGYCERARSSRKKLTVAVVSCDAGLLMNFLQHHYGILLNPELEVLVFCEESMTAVIERFLEHEARIDLVRLVHDGIKSGPNRKRNRLLAEAKGEYVIFMDDDSLFQEPEGDTRRLMSHLGNGTADWILCTACYTMNGTSIVRKPEPIAIGSPGSGIEWNQVMRTSMVRAVGGWAPDFCTGERWRSGGMLDLAFRLRAQGYRQGLLPSVTISHPKQLGGDRQKAISKGLNYRYAIGAILAANLHHLRMTEAMAWVVRLMVFAPLAGCIGLMRGSAVEGVVKLRTPLVAYRGWCDYRRARI